MFSNGDEVLRYISDEGIQFVDIRFCDLPGTMQHFTVPAENFGSGVFEDGLMFDGSSIRGWKAINNSDMLARPDFGTAMIDPFNGMTTLSLVCSIFDPPWGFFASRWRG